MKHTNIILKYSCTCVHQRTRYNQLDNETIEFKADR